MVTMNMFDRIFSQEYEKKWDKIIEYLTKTKGNYLMSLSYLNDVANLDEIYPPAYVVNRMVGEGILDDGVIYHIRDDMLTMTVGYRLKL